MANSKVAQRLLKAASRGSVKATPGRALVKSRVQGADTSPSGAAPEHVEPGYVRIKLGGVTVQAKAMGIAAGRIALPKMIQGSIGLEDAFLVRNVKNPTAPEVLVINPAALDQELRRARPARTLGEIVAVLPFGRQGVPTLRLRELPDAGLDKRLRLPRGGVRAGRQHEAGEVDVSVTGQKR